jgi:hypothetical protein
MSKKFDLVTKYSGYANKADITNISPNFLVYPSQNTIINDQEKVEIRGGFTLDGSAGSGIVGVDSSYDWITSGNTERNIKKVDTKLYYRYVDSLGVVTWRDLGVTVLATKKVNFAEWWSATESIDMLLYVLGDATMNMWSGGVTTFASATVNTITKQGTETWAESHFLKNGTRSVIINGTTYAYTGGEGTTTLTGVTPDPTVAAHAVGSVIHQAVVTTANTPAAGTNNQLIQTLNNYVYVSALNQRTVYISKNTDYLTYTFTSPGRVAGEGGLLTLDAAPVAFIPQEQDMYISAGKDQWYKVEFILSADLTKEELRIRRLKSGPGQGAFDAGAVGPIKNSVLYVTTDKTIDTLGRIENINTPEAVPISDPIKKEISSYGFTLTPHVKYHKNKTHIMFPSESKLLIYDHEKALWNPPQIVPVQRLAIIGGELYGHSSLSEETYKLFDGTNDNGNPIDWKIYMSYRNFGRRDWQKGMDEWFTEGYISSSTIAKMILNYEYQGALATLNYQIDGSNNALLFGRTADGSFGKVPFGKKPLGSVLGEPEVFPKFRVVHNLSQGDCYEIQVGFEGNGLDDQFQLLATGPDAMLANGDNIEIKV